MMCVANAQEAAQNAKHPRRWSVEGAELKQSVPEIPGETRKRCIPCFAENLQAVKAGGLSMAQSVRKPVQHPLIGAGVHFKDEHGRVHNQAAILEIIQTHSAEIGDMALVQYFDWIVGFPSTRALVPLRDMTPPRWVFYASTDEMNDHYDRVDKGHNEHITERLDRDKGPRS